jgi:SAM-dependent methyltransferase
MTVHDSARRGFQRQAEAYERGRPGYPPPAIEWLLGELDVGTGSTVVDVGAGTGKLTRALLPSGASLIAVEPVAAMRGVLERELPTATALDGTAESLPVDSAAADAIVVGQAFHWFDASAALTEFHRVLRPAGRLGLIWNVRDRRQELQRAIDEITEPLRGDVPAQGDRRWHGDLRQSELFVARSERWFPFEVALDADTALDRIGSVSFIAALDDPARRQVLERVRELTVKHPEPWAYLTEAYVYDAVPV